MYIYIYIESPLVRHVDTKSYFPASVSGRHGFDSRLIAARLGARAVAALKPISWD